MNTPFTRTTCACKDCVQCCHDQPGSLVPGDFERIAHYLKLSVDEAKKFFWASPGAIVQSTITNIQRRLGTITPRYDRRKKRCVFLDDQNRCQIHPVAPFGCSHVDTHMGRVEGAEIALWMAREQQNKEYQALRSTLPFADHYKGRRV